MINISIETPDLLFFSDKNSQPTRKKRVTRPSLFVSLIQTKLVIYLITMK